MVAPNDTDALFVILSNAKPHAAVTPGMTIRPTLSLGERSKL